MYDINFSIRVVDEDGDGIEGVRVTVDYAMTIDTQETDDDGWTEFEKEQFIHTSVSGEVFIDGTSYGNYSFEDGDTESFTL